MDKRTTFSPSLKSGGTEKSNIDNTCKEEEDNDIDRLSSLPDCLLLHIFSTLPTFSVVATSVLSKRWVNLWTQVPHLNLSFKHFTSKEIFQIPHSHLPQLVNTYLTTIDKILPRLTSPKIHVFQLSFPVIVMVEYDWTHCSNLVRTWLAQICARNPDAIDLRFCNFYFLSIIRVPSCVLQCKSLVSLALGNGMDFDCSSFEANNISLPKLKKLEITMYDVHRVLMATLFKSKSCPMLEDLRIRTNIDENDHLLDISSHTLRYLSIFSGGDSTGTKVLIDAPNLEEIAITCKTDLICYEVVKKFSGLLHKVDFNICCDCSEETSFSATKLVKELAACARSLSLRGYKFKCFDLTLAEVSGKVTIFSSLTELDFQYWSNFMVMLHCCPNLEKIVWPTYFDFQNVAKDLKESKVPSCLSKNVKRIKVGCLKGTTKELEVLKYILTYAEVLEHLTVHAEYYMSKEELGKEFVFCDQLFCIPMRSERCEIEFCGRFVTASTNGLKNGILDC